ncbi:hypothetical protein SteCoe_11525 [Stentor coeruleus]|uniref:Uncharacterized protein n=1 Tax=Stentor coeruleus TaxID=5963 RepID=A0A1R2CD04_9CILI|nr:hypothetical protein SteCoe_11525 [Stentor coeruleus]
MNSLERKHLQNAHFMIYVLDVKDEPYNTTIEKFLTLQSEIYEMNPFCSFELLLHKLDGEVFSSDESKMLILSEISELIKLNNNERNVPPAEIHLTSIMDLSLHVELSKILQKCHPLLPLTQNLLDNFVCNSMIDKVYIIDVVSKLFVCTDSRPIDLFSYELCCDAIDVAIELSMLYGLKNEEVFEEAFDSESCSIMDFDNGFHLYMRYFGHLLAAVCVIKDEAHRKKEVIDLNYKVLINTFGKMVKTSEKILHTGEEKKIGVKN